MDKRHLDEFCQYREEASMVESVSAVCGGPWKHGVQYLRDFVLTEGQFCRNLMVARTSEDLLVDPIRQKV